MGLIFDWFDKISRYTKFKPREMRAGLITIGVLAFAISFGGWGIGQEVDIGIGFVNLVGALVIVAISFFARLAFQKMVASGADVQAEYKMWSFGLLLYLLIVFLTNGKGWFLFLIPGGIIVHFLSGHRLGWTRYGFNWFGTGVVSMAGPAGSILTAMVFKILFEITNAALMKTAYLFNLIWAVWTVLPIPPADGSRMFFGSRPTYMFGFAIVISAAILLYTNIPIFITIPLSFIIGGLWWLIYYVIWERFNWRGPY